jgi:serine/threonine protein kinase
MLIRTTDLNEGAIMWDMPSISECSTATIYRLIGRPKKMLLSTYFGDDLWKHGEHVVPVTPPLELLGRKLYLGDFGLIIKDGASVSTKMQAPYNYCAPERLHGEDPSRASDMWSYMCLFCTLYLGFNIFYGSGQSLAYDWFRQLGPIPDKWKGKYWWVDRAKDEWYDLTGLGDQERDLMKRIATARPDTSQAEQELVVSVMRKGFCYLPENRMTATQLLEDPSFRAILEIYRC